MLSELDCPVCGGQAWEVVGQRTYRAADISRLGPLLAERYQVLFELWFPDRVTVELQAKLCSLCGFILYTPRPSQRDLDAKYEYLTRASTFNTKARGEDDNNRRRAKALCRRLGSYVRRTGAKILDYGGMDGALVRPLVAQGCECYVVDYDYEPVPGVQRLGRTLDQVPNGMEFDVIVCSHVLEHLADPYKALADLRRHLAPAGVLYVEVPMEIWLMAALQGDPVTHINFFAPGSLRALLERVGYRVLRCRLGRSRHARGVRHAVVRAFATPGERSPRRAWPAAVAEVRRLLSPDWCMFLRMLAVRPDWVCSYAWQRLNSARNPST